MLGRKHWLSDTVAGSFAGYWMGRLEYKGTQRRGDAPRVAVFAARVSALAAPRQLWLHVDW